jgi:hypothetical protein
MADEPSDPGVEIEVESRPDRKKAIIAVSIAVVVAVVVFGVILPQLVDWNEVFDILREVDKVDFALILLPGGSASSSSAAQNGCSASWNGRRPTASSAM